MFFRQPRHAGTILRSVAALVVVVCACHFWLNSALAQNAANKVESKKDTVDEKSIRALITQLGDDSFEVREKASKGLAAIGDPALALLRAEAKTATDPEVRERVDLLIAGITSAFFVQVRSYERPPEKQINWTTRLAVTPDGKRAVAVGYGSLRCWDLAAGKTDVAFDWPDITFSWALGMAPNGQRVIVGSDDRVARIFDMKTGKLVGSLVGHTGDIWGAALLDDGKRALTGGLDQSLRLWDVESGKQIRSFENVPEHVRCLAVSPDSKLVAAGHYTADDVGGIVRLWDLETGKEVRALKGHTKAVTSVAFAPNGKTLVSSSFDTTVRLWNVADGTELKTLKGHTSRVEAVAFTPNGKRLISIGDQNNPVVKLWDAASGTQLYQGAPTGEGFLSVAALPDGFQCVTAGKDGSVRLWKWK